MKLRILGLASMLLPAALLSAQTDRVTVRLSPAPNQTLHQHVTVAMVMTTSFDPAAPGATAMPPQQVEMTTTADVTTTVGATDGRGYYDARVVSENTAATMTMNGKTMPAPAGLPGMAAPVMIFHYDDQGRPLGVGPEANENGMATAMLQAMSGVLATAPPITLAVGETVTVPMNVNMPVPAAQPAGLSLKGETSMTLTSVTFDGADRIAHLSVNTTTSMETSGDAGPMAAAMNMKSSGGGKMDVNIDRGIVLHTELTTTIDSSSFLAPGAPRGMAMKGTVTVTADYVK